MRRRISRGRGRPRGKYRSAADSRILEYLALISMKYGVDSHSFFNSFVEAWDHQKSTCKSLSIECRKKTSDRAVFLVTESFKVVAQFSLPKHIIEAINPLKDFVSATASRSTISKRLKRKHLQIGDLEPGMKQINLKAKVLRIPKPRSVVTRFGEFAKVTNASIKDETGIIRLPLWNKQIDAVSVGDLIHVENARVVTFRGERQLRISRGGELNVVKKVAHLSGASFEKVPGTFNR